jgi:hypothetical protein
MVNPDANIALCRPAKREWMALLIAYGLAPRTRKLVMIF